MWEVMAETDVDLETPEGVEDAFRRRPRDRWIADMRAADIDFMTIGQYLQPTPKHHRVDRFVTPDEFKGYEKSAYGKGFLMVSATPLTRSSYHAGDDFAQLRTARMSKLGLA